MKSRADKADENRAVLTFNETTFLELSEHAELLAKLEGLQGHAAASEYRRNYLVGE
jgi:histidinol dehydrogenase